MFHGDEFMVTIFDSIDKHKIKDLEPIHFPGRIVVIYTELEARKAVDFLNTHHIVGIDTETRPSFKKGRINKVALLQIATHDICFLFRLNVLGLPDFLEDFLQNDILKVGLSLKDDFAMLRRRNPNDPTSGNWLELQDYVPTFGIKEKSLQKIYALLFQRKISKNQRLTNWEAEVLTEAQQLYAATDAWACIRIFEYLEKLKADKAIQVIHQPESIE